MRILLIEDNEELGLGIMKLLGKTYAIDQANNGEYAISSILVQDYDLVILDLGLPDMDGLDVLKEIRSNRKSTPVLILTARGALDDRISGLDLGADDYMTKPFEIDELQARVRALLRRVSMEKTSLLEFGAINLDVRSNVVLSGSEPIEMTPREIMVLQALMMASGRLLSKSQLLESITNFEEDVSENAIEQYVSRVRKKLAPHGVTIHAARGLGYHLRELN
ncbi:response regulator transcription factor [Lentilitoribacter sp. Alg239-R112]|uniref:response regulator transcription factor n=1 Tax=Lentilitoribacter sp. Alg239-R112 TaxID=2305987 RepID=UPI0013A6BF7F|nr:response regulator transcription factor [Lentilitoribacter sp. Alg239-R112]